MLVTYNYPYWVLINIIKIMRTKTKTLELTEREYQILYLVANGSSNPEIANSLCLSPNTIKAVMAAILKKLHAKNRAQAVFIAVKSNLLK